MKTKQVSMTCRVSFPQLETILAFMERHPELARGQMRDAAGRHTSKSLWHQLAIKMNALGGAVKSPKGWAKYWADKKCSVRRQLAESENTCLSDIDKRICTISGFGDKEYIPLSRRRSVKNEMSNNCDDEKSIDADDVTNFEFNGQPIADVEERQMVVMEKLVKVMGDQATALSQMAQASQLQAKALDRLADASTLQAHALERLSNSFQNISSSAQETKNAIVSIDNTMKKIYSTAPT